jgi:hypothetical protein
LGLRSGFFPSVFPTKTSYAHLLSPIHVIRPAHFILLYFITWIVFVEQYRSLNSSLCSFSPLPCYLVPLRPKYSKYSPHYPILKHSQPTFLPQCERPSFIQMQNNRQNYISV